MKVKQKCKYCFRGFKKVAERDCNNCWINNMKYTMQDETPVVDTPEVVEPVVEEETPVE
jgi:hypothetical protein